MSAWTYHSLMARPPERLFHLVFESHSGRALVPSPKRSASPRATSTLQWRIGLKALDPQRPIREADICSAAKFPLFDHLVGAIKDGWRDGKTDCLRGLEIDDEFKLGWKLNRELVGFCAFEDFIDVGGRPAKND